MNCAREKHFNVQRVNNATAHICKCYQNFGKRVSTLLTHYSTEIEKNSECIKKHSQENKPRL